MAKEVVNKKLMSIRLACCTFQISETCYRYKAKLSKGNELIAKLLIGLTQNQRNWGFGLCFLYLRNVRGFKWNHKRVYRIYCELQLNMRIKPRKRLKRAIPEPLSVTDRINVGQWILCMTNYQMVGVVAYLMLSMILIVKSVSLASLET